MVRYTLRETDRVTYMSDSDIREICFNYILIKEVRNHHGDDKSNVRMEEEWEKVYLKGGRYGKVGLWD